MGNGASSAKDIRHDRLLYVDWQIMNLAGMLPGKHHTIAAEKLVFAHDSDRMIVDGNQAGACAPSNVAAQGASGKMLMLLLMLQRKFLSALPAELLAPIWTI